VQNAFIVAGHSTPRDRCPPSKEVAKAREHREMAEHAVVTIKVPLHSESIECGMLATYPLKRASRRKPVTSNKSAMVADDAFPPCSNANKDGGI